MSDAPNLVPKWAGQFDTFGQWVNRASAWLTGHKGSCGEELRAICVDTLGRRCNIGKDFMRARDEGTFPVRFFFECEPAPQIEISVDIKPAQFDGTYRFPDQT